MSKCELQVVLDQPERAFQVGDEVSGHVEVSVNTSCTCNGLTITQRWRTHGRGNTARGPAESLTLFTGDWQPGEVHSFPFSFKVPAGPLTYHGHYLNVDWYLEAQADIPWALDPKAEAEYLLELGDVDPRDLEQFTMPISRGQRSGGPVFCVALFLAPFILMGGLAFVAGLGMLATGKGQGAFMLLWGSMFGGIPGLILGLMLRNTFAQRKLGPVELSFEPNSLGPGEGTRVHLGFQPHAEIKVNKITATFKGQEIVVSGSGTNKTTHTHTLFEEEHEITGECTLRRREHVDFKLDLEVPDDAPWSFSAPSNTLSWVCVIHIDIARWPDWKDEVPLVVLPPKGKASA